MLKDNGEIKLEEADEANIPVNISIDLEDDNEFHLTADCYQPRRGVIEQGSFDVSGTQEELQEAVRKHFLPLYETALKKIQGIVTGHETGLYYWSH